MSEREADAMSGLRDERADVESQSSGGTSQEPLELYRLLVESIQDYAVFALDRTGHILTWNEGATRAKGYRADEILGRHFSIFYAPDDVTNGKPERLLAQALREGRVEDQGWRLRKDGSRFWADVVISPLRDEDGELLGFAKVTRDLTDRRAAEEALRESEERFRLLVQTVKDYAIFMLDPSGRIVSWNEGAQRIKGYPAAEAIGRSFAIFYTREDRDAHKPERELEIAAQSGTYEEEGWRVRRDGTRFWANVVITAVRDERNRLVGYAKVTRDMTELRAAQELALEEAKKLARIEAANRAKTEFLAAMSHELRTPLNAIGGYVDLLLMGVRGPLTNEQRSDMERIRHGQQHLLGIITDLLNFSRIEAGRLDYDITAVPMQEVVDAVSLLIVPLMTLKGLSYRVDPGPDIEVEADRLKLEQVLLNLLSNAVKFTPSGGAIVVSWRRAEDRAELRVQDTGVGIPADKLDNIFEPFVQLGRSLTSIQEGTGLGLAISRDLARAMKGDLSVVSRVGEGSTFFLSMPLAGAASSSETGSDR